MNDAFEASALRSLVDQLSAQVTQLSMQVTMMQNNRNDAWVNNIPTHFTPIPMANGGGGGDGIYPYKVKLKGFDKDNGTCVAQIYLPNRYILQCEDLDVNIMEAEGVNFEEDSFWATLDTPGLSGENTFVVILYVLENKDDGQVIASFKTQMEGEEADDLIDTDYYKVLYSFAIAEVSVKKGVTYYVQKVSQFVRDAIIIHKPIAQWVDPDDYYDESEE